MQHNISDYTDDKKNRIRKRYRKQNDNVLEIPAAEVAGLYDENNRVRVAVYARVSTDSDQQTSSYELQKVYYEEMVEKHPNWELIDIYADEGISGTSLEHRDDFNRLMRDCMDGKIDLIVTKNVPRFARNVEDCVHWTKKLRFLKKPVGVLFETENIYTLNDQNDMSLTFTATMAQEESHAKSESMKRSYHMRFSRGIFMTPTLLGYDKDEDGDLIVNEDEARTVRLIFLMFLSRYNCSEIALFMMTLRRHTKVKLKSGKINWNWTGSTVYSILRNERYCGDVLAQKTYTPNYLDHRSKKNNLVLPQYYEKDHHEAIVSREDFVAVQRLLDQKKYGFKKALPELKAVDSGVLKGFVQINPRWTGFSEDDYLEACHNVLSDNDYLNPLVLIKKYKGDFCLEGYQVTRGQFVPTVNKIAVNFSRKYMRFSQQAVDALEGEQFIELLYHPLYDLMVVRPGSRNDKHSIKWSELKNDRFRSKRINGQAFIHILYELCGWDEQNKYTLSGYAKEQNGEKILLFYVDEPEIRVMKGEKELVVYPKEWVGRVGDSWHEQAAKTQSVFAPDRIWDLKKAGVISKKPDFVMRDQSELDMEVDRLMRELKDEVEKGTYDGHEQYSVG